MSYHRFPKIELHLHLDSSLSYKVVKQQKPEMTPAQFSRNFVAPAKCNNLPDYLDRVARQVNYLQTSSQLEMAARDLIHRLDDDNIIYAEIRFAPLLHTRKGLTPREVVETVSEAISSASATARMEANLILCTLRNFSEEQCMITAGLVEEFIGSNVVGLDIAGDEDGYPLDANIPAFEYVRMLGIPCTAHAGEACGPKSVWETVEHLQPERIGHGVRSLEDPTLVDYLKEHNIHLEVCPTSNIQTDVYDAIGDHTIADLFEEDVSLSINTDGKTTSNITLTEEYQKLADIFGWGKKEFLACNLNAVDAAFLSDSKKDALRNKLEKGYA